jgi:hypothetical protein
MPLKPDEPAIVAQSLLFYNRTIIRLHAQSNAISQLDPIACVGYFLPWAERGVARKWLGQ